MSEINNYTINPSITTHNVDIKKLQAGEKLTIPLVMAEFKKLIELFSKALNTKNLDTFYVKHKENETPVKTYISQNVNKKDGAVKIKGLNDAIGKTLKRTDELSMLIALAADNNSKELKGEKRPECLNKIKIDLEPSQKLSTNNAIGQPTVTARGVNDQNAPINKKGDTLKLDGFENNTKFWIKEDYAEHVLLKVLENGKYGKLV